MQKLYAVLFSSIRTRATEKGTATDFVAEIVFYAGETRQEAITKAHRNTSPECPESEGWVTSISAHEVPKWPSE